MWTNWTFSQTNNFLATHALKWVFPLDNMIKLWKNFTGTLEHLLFHNLCYVGQVHFNAVLILISWYTHRLKVACLIQFIVHCNIKWQFSVIFIVYMNLWLKCYFTDVEHTNFKFNLTNNNGNQVHILKKEKYFLVNNTHNCIK